MFFYLQKVKITRAIVFYIFVLVILFAHIQIIFQQNEKMDFIFLQKLRDLDSGVNTLISVSNSTPKIEIKDENKENICGYYVKDGQLNRYYLPTVWKNHVKVNVDDITLATQLSLSQFHLVELHIKQWSGPMSITIYINVTELKSIKQIFLEYNSILKRKNIDIHLVLAEGVCIVC